MASDIRHKVRTERDTQLQQHKERIKVGKMPSLWLKFWHSQDCSVNRLKPMFLNQVIKVGHILFFSIRKSGKMRKKTKLIIWRSRLRNVVKESAIAIGSHWKRLVWNYEMTCCSVNIVSRLCPTKLIWIMKRHYDRLCYCRSWLWQFWLVVCGGYPSKNEIALQSWWLPGLNQSQGIDWLLFSDHQHHKSYIGSNSVTI